MQVTERLGSWIERAQADGDIDPALPPEVVLLTIFARGCDPVPAFLKSGGNFSDEQIVQWVMTICLRGLRPGP
jgi:TetR/AcrR family transcriptional regulator, regulator of autoinduction and epiphytic fitness